MVLADCEKAIRFTLPAVRISVALELINRHGMLQADVAKAIGVAQAEVSKYVGGKYSARVRKVRLAVETAGLQLPIAEMVLKGAGAKELSRSIDKAASTQTIVEAALVP